MRLQVTNDHSSLNLEKLFWRYKFERNRSSKHQWEFVLSQLLLQKRGFSKLAGDYKHREKEKRQTLEIKLWPFTCSVTFHSYLFIFLINLKFGLALKPFYCKLFYITSKIHISDFHEFSLMFDHLGPQDHN